MTAGTSRARQARRRARHRRVRMGRALVEAYLRGPMRGRCHRRTTPATGCGWRWRTAPTWRTWARRGGCRSCRFPATPSTAIRAAAACDSSAPAREASSSTGQASDSSTRRANTTRWRARSSTSTRAHGYVNDPAWIVFDSLHLKRYGFLGVEPDEPAPDWFSPSADLAELGDKTGIDADGLARTLRRVERQRRPRDTIPTSAAAQALTTGTGATTTPRPRRARRSGPSTPPRTYAVPVPIGAMGTKGGPRTDRDGRVLHVSGVRDPGPVRRGQRDGRCHREGIRRRRRDPRPRNGIRLPRRPSRISAFLGDS